MKKIIDSFLTLLVLATVYSCKDDSLDPLQVNKIQKGKLLALRGTQLQNIYVVGRPGAEFFPRIATNADQFVFDAEYLAEDPNSLESLDIFVLKSNGTPTPDKVLVQNVPFSSFKKDATYRNPWVTVTIPLTEILSKLGLANTYPLNAATVNTLLTTYKFGISIWTDLKLKDGSIAPADRVVASGLFQSDQFYPAQKLVYTVTDYCTYNAASWAGSYDATEIYPSGFVTTYAASLVQDVTNPNRFNFNNFWGYGYTAYMIFTPSTNPSTQRVNFPEQVVGNNPNTGSKINAGSTGTYDQCLGTITINLNYTETGGADAGTYNFRYVFQKK
ncbi:MAG: hypothetical protein ACK55U_05405 [Bacteroidota bacterium]